MEPLIAQTVSPALLVGSLVIVWGSLVLGIGMTESWRQRNWSDRAREVGTSAICAGTAIAFVGTTLDALSGTDVTLLNGGLLVMALTLVSGLLAPRVARRQTEQPRTDRRKKKREGHSIDAQQHNHAGVGAINAVGLQGSPQDVAKEEHEENLTPKAGQAPHEAFKP